MPPQLATDMLSGVSFPRELTLSSLTLLGGLILGLVSSLHCVVMCGGVGGALSMTLGRTTAFRDRARALMTAQAGKLVSYVAAGALVGGFGSTLYGLFDQHAAYAVLQRFGALVLIWTAVSLTGLLPSPAVLGRLFAPLSRWAWAEKRRGHGLAALTAGLVWGLLPCGMVYAALMYAMLAGDALRGGMVMLGFGLGVSPLLTASSLGVAWLGKSDRRPVLQWAAGLALIAISAATLIWPEAAGALCRPAQ